MARGTNTRAWRMALLGGVLILASSSGAIAQQPPVCQERPEFRDFDFWVGEWDVTGRANGNKAGTNRIESINNGCLLVEHWQSSSGGTGTSMNYFDPVTDEWRQVWVSNNLLIDIKGGLNDEGQMVLVGELHNYAQARSFPFRGTWTAQDDGSVRQFFEQQDAEGVWNTWFDGLYVRQEP